MNSHIIFNFNNKTNIENWVIVDDILMGGRSSGNIKLSDEGHGVFEGAISLENNGGFSSVLYRFEKIQIKNFTKIILKIKGDGKIYQFRIKSNSDDKHSYIFPFSTTGEWQEIQILLKDMYSSFRGRKLDQANFSNDYIEEFTFLIGNKKQEEFKLLIDRIELK
jgi:NADH dehydrogenase [ubiquinone] 1 alpha subcomplex assembly factor 1